MGVQMQRLQTMYDAESISAAAVRHEVASNMLYTLAQTHAPRGKHRCGRR